MEDFNQSHSEQMGRANTTPLSISVLFFVASALILIVLAIKFFIIGQANTSQFNTSEVALPQVYAAPRTPIWQTIDISQGDTLAGIFYRNNLNQQDLAAITHHPHVKKTLRHIKPGNQVKLLINPDGSLQKLSYQITADKFLEINKINGTFVAKTISENLETRVTNAHGVIKSSLYQATKHAGLPNSMLWKLSKIFAWQINFKKDLRPGDSFNILYERKYLGDKFVETGDIVAAEFFIKGKAYKAIRFKSPNGHVAYYTPNGHSLKKAFIRFPVKYVYISSKFNMGRKHPILGFKRPHEGVDLAAYRGTPVKAAGAGIVKFRGKRGGYGNLVILKHGHGITTRYGHLLRFAKGIKPAKHVKMGQTIAYVGRTGLATGYHLHFEYRINNVPKNPVKIALPQAAPVPRKYRKAFLQEARTYIAQLDRIMPTPYQLRSVG